MLDNTGIGYYSLQYKGKGTPKEIVQKVLLVPNTYYELSVMLKVKKGTQGKVLFDTKGVFDKTCKFELESNIKSDEWVEFKGVFNSGDNRRVNLRCTTTNDFEGTACWDNVVLKVK